MTGSLQERADLLRLNATPEERVAIAAHELGHYEMSKRAGVQPEGITIGHHPADPRSPSRLAGIEIDTGLTHYIDQWQQQMVSITDEVERRRFLDGFLKSLYAGEVAEELVTEKPTDSGTVDSAMARHWMWKAAMLGNVILSEGEIGQKECRLKQDVRNELCEPETKRRLSHAAQQLAENHFDSQRHPASTIDHYLNGGTRQNLPREGQ